MNKSKNKNYSKPKKVISEMKLEGYKYLRDGFVCYKGYLIDLSATEPEPLSIVYATLQQT